MVSYKTGVKMRKGKNFNWTMKINTAFLKGLNPCADRYKNWLEHYKDFEGSLEEFFGLEKITHKDKIWVGVRCLSLMQKVEAACLFVEKVLPIFEEEHPKDNRPRKAIEAARSVINGVNGISSADVSTAADDAGAASWLQSANSAAACAASAAACAARAAASASSVVASASNTTYWSLSAAEWSLLASNTTEELSQLNIILGLLQ